MYNKIREIINNGCKPVAFLDFDGTVINGDVTEGSSHFKGLVEILIESDQSTNIKDYSLFKSSYNKLSKKEAFTSALTIFSRSSIDNITPIIIKAYKEIYQHYIRDYMRDIILILYNLGVDIYIITASPTIFVSEIIHYLPIKGVLGIECEINNNILTDKITQYPYGPGKVEVIRNFLQIHNNYVPVFGAGDSIEGDYPFLSYLQSLDAIALLINY